MNGGLVADDDRSRSWWATTWPLDRHDGVTLAVAYVSVVAVGALVGRMLYDWFAPTALTDLDDRVAVWMSEHRSDGLNTFLEWGGRLSDTIPKVIVSTLVAAAMLYAFRRWREAALVGLSLLFEALAFILMSTIVQRDRPPDELAIETSPVDTSFPSGHIAAATVYAAFAVIVFWHTRKVWARALAVVLSVAVVAIVASSRVYEAAHFLSDAIGGIVLGLVSLAIAVKVVGAPYDAAGGDGEPDGELERAEARSAASR